MTPPVRPDPAAPAAPITVTPQDRIIQQTPIVPVPATPTAPAKSAVEVATDRARANIAAGKPVVSPAATQARHPGTGEFIEPGRLDQAREAGSPKAGQAAPAAAPAALTPPAAPAATEPVAGQPDPNETEEQRVAREAAEATAATETPEEKAAREARDLRTVIFTDPRGENVEIELPDGTPQEVLDTLKFYRNSALRSAEVREAERHITERANALTEREQQIELDPTGWMLDLVADAPTIRLDDGTEIDVVEHTVLHLLTQPKVWERLSPRVQQLLEDDKELRATRAETNAQRSSIREEMRTVAEERAAVSRNLADVQATIGAILPATMPQAQQRMLYDDCLRDLQGYAGRHRLLTLPVNDIPAILATRLTANGINPAEAATRAAESATRRAAATGATRPASPARPAAPAPAARPAPAPKTGQRFVASAAQKQVAGAIPAGGAGSPSAAASLTPPNNPDGSKMSIEQRTNWHREQLRKGVKRY
jgi:hypothetical protein